MDKKRVYITSKGSHDYSKAEEYGEPVILFEESANVFATDSLVKDVGEKLKDSTPDDYLILSGSMLPSSIAFHTLMKKHGLVNNLIYSFRGDVYELRTIRATQFDLK